MQQFEQKITPERHWAELREKIGPESPERAKEIVKESLKKTPEQIYESEFHYKPEEIEAAQKQAGEIQQREKQQALQYLFEIAKEKGPLNASQVARKMDPSIEDEFHDLIVQELRGQEKNDQQ